MTNFLRTTATTNERVDRSKAYRASRDVMRAFLREDSGQDLVDYGLLSALVGVAAVLIWQQLVARSAKRTAWPMQASRTFQAALPIPAGRMLGSNRRIPMLAI